MTRFAACGLASFIFLGAGCAAPPGSKSAQSPQSTQPNSSKKEQEKAGGEAEATDAPPRADVLYDPHPAVPPAPDSCTLGGPLPAQAQCTEARPDLAEALAQEAIERDAALAKLETCVEFPRGVIRALRAELGEAECGDVLVLSVIGADAITTDLRGDVRETLVAIALGARLRRLVQDGPEPPHDHSKATLDEYFQTALFPWTSSQAQAIFSMASQGTQLSGYARGIVAVEAGNADMRFVELVRGAPLAKEISEHQEAKDLYYATLDEHLEPRKARGRNAALVGLREMARVGIRKSERVDSARSLLSRVYGGRRVNALDSLLVPNLAAQKVETAAAGIASRVPSSYAGTLVGQTDLSAPLVRAYLQMGMPVSVRTEILSTNDVPTRLLLARALFESGRTYFRAEDFQAAQSLLTATLDDATMSQQLTPTELQDARLLRALSVALVAGPRDAAELIAQGPRFADALGNLAVLDRLAEQTGELGGQALFDAAYLRELIAPTGDPDYWKDLSQRYARAAQQLKGAERRIASERSRACLETEKALILDQKSTEATKHK